MSLCGDLVTEIITDLQLRVRCVRCSDIWWLKLKIATKPPPRKHKRSAVYDLCLWADKKVEYNVAFLPTDQQMQR